MVVSSYCLYVFINDTATTKIYTDGHTLSRHDALPIYPVAWYEGTTMSSGRQMLLADHQGSIVSMADAGGALAGINSYDEWGVPDVGNSGRFQRSEEHTSELQSLMRISYAVFCLQKKTTLMRNAYTTIC